MLTGVSISVPARRTAEYAFRRMWLDDPPTPRFLVADEVGLGKTMVARGMIARTIEHLKARGVGRIDVAYVCSNAAIAQQNVNRLNVLDDDHLSMASRLTLLPLELHRLEDNAVNFVSFTPGTTFNHKGPRKNGDRSRARIHRLSLRCAPFAVALRLRLSRAPCESRVYAPLVLAPILARTLSNRAEGSGRSGWCSTGSWPGSCRSWPSPSSTC